MSKKKSLRQAALAACLITIAGTASAFVSTRQVCFHACSAPENYPAKCNGIAKPRRCFAFRKLVRKCMRYGAGKVCPEVTTTPSSTEPTTTTTPESIIVVVPGPAGPTGPSGPMGPSGPEGPTVESPVTTTTLPVNLPATTTTTPISTTTTFPLSGHCKFNSDCASGKCRHRSQALGGNVCDPN